MTPLKIYLSGPYTASTLEETEANVDKAIEAADSLYRKGHFPFVPHLTHYVDLAQLPGGQLKWEDYMRCDLAWLEVADAMFFMGHSPGADYELSVAKRLGMRIFYSLDEIEEGKDTKHYEFVEIKGDRKCL